MLEISGHTKQLGIIGYPIEHTFSPRMHNFISEKISNDYVYSAWCVHPDNLKEAMEGIRALGIAGVNVTAPHKIDVMKYIDVVSEQAKLLGSVNTVVNRGGRLYGYNTDSEGFYTALKKAGIVVENSRILIFGAGGVVKPTIIRLTQANPKSITVVNRTKEKVLGLAKAIKDTTGFEIETEVREKRFDIVINTTSAGMAPQLDKLPIDAINEFDDLSFIDENTSAVDMIYNPAETLFLKAAKKYGAKIAINGLGMLIYQGIIAYELFTDTKLLDDMGDIIKEEVFNR